jgi:regulator of sigma E protease
VAGEKVNRLNTVTSVAKQHIGEEIEYEFLRDGDVVSVSMMPSEAGLVGMSLLSRYSDPMIGFGVQETYFPVTINDFNFDISVWEAPFVSLQNGWEISKLTAVGFVTTIMDAFLKFDISEEVGGPVQVAKMSYEFVGLGGTELMNFVALISLSLAVINILPIPALDGGRILFVLVEALRAKPLNRKLEAYIHALGFLILMLFIFVITIFDLLRL